MGKNIFDKKELVKFKTLLLDKKKEIFSFLHRESVTSHSLSTSGDVVDITSSLMESEQTLSFTERERQILEDINEALLRIENNTYGICIDSNEQIPIGRLEAIPEAKRTVRAQEYCDKHK